MVLRLSFLLLPALASLDTVAARLGDRRSLMLSVEAYGANPGFILGECRGDCDSDEECEEGLICFQRGANMAVPGCLGGEEDPTPSDYCIKPPTPAPSDEPTSVPSDPPSPAPSEDPTSAPVGKPSAAPSENPTSPPSGNPTTSISSEIKSGDAMQSANSGVGKVIKDWGINPSIFYGYLQECEGDCDKDSHCSPGLYCYFRDEFEPTPGCWTGDVNAPLDPSVTDVCIPDDRDPSTYYDSEPFYLKMYWEHGYYWQEEVIEREWCATCKDPNDCQAGQFLFLNNCTLANQTTSDNIGLNQVRFKYVDRGQALINVVGTDLCLNRIGEKLYLDQCDITKETMTFFAKGLGASFDDESFEISLRSASQYCMTNRHHPKPLENLALESCSLARSSDTSKWEICVGLDNDNVCCHTTLVDGVCQP